MGSSEFSFTQDGPRMAILHLIVLAFVATNTHAEAEAEADADAQVHHGGTYGYTPVPAPVYGPEPAYHVSAPVYHQSGYHEAPVYEAAVTPFIHHETPAPAYGVAPVAHHAVVAPVAHHAAPVSTVHHATHDVAHHGAAHHQSVVQHHVTPVHHAVAHPVAHAAPVVAHAAPYHPAPAPHHDAYKPPVCSVDNPKTWCLEDPEYPTYEIEHALQYHYEGVQANTENSVDRLKEIVQETYLCPSVTAYIMPLRAVNTDGKWRVVVNGVKAHYETLTQTARIEECTTAGEACPLVPACYETKCLQKSIYHRFLVYDPYDQYFPFAIETFKLPSACACYNGAYVEPPHKK